MFLADALDTLPPSAPHVSAVALSSLPPTFNRPSERGSVALPARQDSHSLAPAGTRSPCGRRRGSSIARALPESRKPPRTTLGKGPAGSLPSSRLARPDRQRSLPSRSHIRRSPWSPSPSPCLRIHSGIRSRFGANVERSGPQPWPERQGRAFSGMPIGQGILDRLAQLVRF